MSQNVGTIDRAIRIVIGLVLIAFAIPIGFPVDRMELDRMDRRCPDPDGLHRQLSGL